MHVLVLPSWYYPPNSTDIRGRMFHQLAQSLRKANVDARIFYADLNVHSTFGNEFNYAVENDVPTWRAHQWFPPKVHSIIIKKWIEKYLVLLHEYIARQGKPDIVHAQSYLAGMVAAALRKKTGIPYVITERLSQFITEEVPRRYKPFIADTYKNANSITCVSPGLKKYLQAFTAMKIDVISNFYDGAIFYPDAAILKNDIFTWVSVGEPAKVKGLDMLMQAFGEFRKANASLKMQLIMIDRVEEKERLIEIARSYGAEHDIRWTGLISQVEMARIFRSSHVLISASRIETFGKAILEAQACGLPVIATKTDGAQHIMASVDQGILTATNDTKGLVRAMGEMFTHYARFDPQKINVLVHHRFSEAIVIHQWKELYTHIKA